MGDAGVVDEDVEFGEGEISETSDTIDGPEMRSTWMGEIEVPSAKSVMVMAASEPLLGSSEASRMWWLGCSARVP
jgi:hypothetical protein